MAALPPATTVALERALRLAQSSRFRVERIDRSDPRRVEVVAVVAGLPVPLRLRPLGDAGGGPWFLCGALAIEVVPSAAPEPVVAEAVRRLAARPLRAPAAWRDVALAAVAEPVWQVLGARVWPGASLTGDWVTRELRITPGVAHLAVARDVNRLDLVVTPCEAGPAAPPATAVLRSASLALGAGGALTPGRLPADLVQGLRELIRESGDGPVDLAPEVAALLDPPVREAPAAPPPSPRPATPAASAPHAGPPAARRAAPPGSLVVTFRDRERRHPDFVFYLGRAHARRRSYRQVGEVAIAYASRPGSPAPTAPLFAACVAALEAAARRVGAAPSAGNEAEWRVAIDEAVAASPVGRACDHTVGDG